MAVAPLLDSTVPLRPPRRMDPLYGWIRSVQDRALDIVGCHGSAQSYRRELDDLDARSDAALLAALRAAENGGHQYIAQQIRTGLFLDEQERRPLGRLYAALDAMATAGREIVARVERLLSAPTKPRPARPHAGRQLGLEIDG